MMPGFVEWKLGVSSLCSLPSGQLLCYLSHTNLEVKNGGGEDDPGPSLEPPTIG